jgi:hypothetical protein
MTGVFHKAQFCSISSTKNKIKNKTVERSVPHRDVCDHFATNGPESQPEGGERGRKPQEMRIPKFGWVTGSGETTECLIKKKKSGI